MRVQLLYIDDCPSWETVEARLVEALELTGRAPDMERVLVATLDDAERWGFLGSPAVLIDGEDPFAELGVPISLSCRLYRTSEGLEGAPTVRQLVDALSRN